MIETWWIRRWDFLYISVSIIMPNFRNTCHVEFVVLWIVVRMLNDKLCETI
ncbi:hypothetical protein Hanom_Chr11g01016321 [Helianthus anomalus]